MVSKHIGGLCAVRLTTKSQGQVVWLVVAFAKRLKELPQMVVRRRGLVLVSAIPAPVAHKVEVVASLAVLKGLDRKWVADLPSGRESLAFGCDR